MLALWVGSKSGVRVESAEKDRRGTRWVGPAHASLVRWRLWSLTASRRLSASQVQVNHGKVCVPTVTLPPQDLPPLRADRVAAWFAVEDRRLAQLQH